MIPRDYINLAYLEAVSLVLFVTGRTKQAGIMSVVRISPVLPLIKTILSSFV